jgi:hypothetical protein
MELDLVVRTNKRAHSPPPRRSPSRRGGAHRSATDRSRQIWTGLNAELAAHSTIVVHRVVVGASHMALALDRDHTQATIAVIQQVVAAAQTAMLIQP